MHATRKPFGSRRNRALVGALAAATCLLGGAGSAAQAGSTHTAADGAGATASADVARFAVDSPPMIQAELIATKYWNTSPCGGVVSVTWASMDPSINGTSNWWNPVSAYGNAGANSQCRITLNQDQDFDWPMFCTVMVHEIGHLVGQQHSTDQTSVMYPIYVTPIAACKGTAPGTAAAPPVATRTASSASLGSGTGHKAHSRHKAHKRHKAKKHA